jgi:hypothetical protein
VGAGGGVAWGQPQAPHVGYVYPAGGRQGTVVRAVVGGQFLQGAEDVYVSGTGVSGRVVEYVRPLDNEELGRSATFLRNLVRRRWSLQALRGAGGGGPALPSLPDHPWLRDLDERSPWELSRLRRRLFSPKRQPNAQIAEQVELELSIAADAAPGDRELRLLTPAGLSNPVRFQVGTLPEVREEEVGSALGEPGPAVELPVVLNGQILPGEVDRFRLRAHRGQRLVVRMQARRLIPYLADAVPGWCQGVLALYGPRGEEIAYADDYRFDPDPVVYCPIGEEGVYTLEVRDALYRGREDFVYRIVAGELPFITDLFPLGGRAGARVVARVRGWNLPSDRLELDTTAAGPRLRQVVGRCTADLGNEVWYVVDRWAETREAEPNDAPGQAQLVTAPVVVNGRIDRPGDLDRFSFGGKAGEEWVVEVWARRLGSPLDAVLRLLDENGAVVASDDDHPDPEAALYTHHADPYLRIKLPKDGVYQVQLADVQQHGGEEYGYRLYLRRPQPDFALLVTPSSLSVPARQGASLTVHAVRKDGFAGEIEVVLKEAPAGFVLSQTRIAADQEAASATLTPPSEAAGGIFAVRLEGRAQIGGRTVTHEAVPAEEMMQAFAYRHLVPQQELRVAVLGSRPVPAVWRPLVAGIELASPTPLRLPLGRTCELRLKAPETLPDPLNIALADVDFRLCAPARGVTLQRTSVTRGGVSLVFKADANIARVGDKGYLIIEAAGRRASRSLPSGRSAFAYRTSLGVLPPVAFEIVPSGP